MIALATRTADNLEEAVHLREDLLGSLELLRLAGRYCPAIFHSRHIVWKSRPLFSFLGQVHNTNGFITLTARTETY